METMAVYYTEAQAADLAITAERRAVQTALTRSVGVLEGVRYSAWPEMLAQAVGDLADGTTDAAAILYAVAVQMVRAATEREVQCLTS